MKTCMGTSLMCNVKLQVVVTSDFNVGCRNAARNNAMRAAKSKRTLLSGNLSDVIFRNSSSSNTPVSKYCTTTEQSKYEYSLKASFKANV